MQLYLIRHPEPRACLGRCYGRLDLTVDPEAIAAAVTAVRQRLPGSLLQTARVYTSPLARCAALAHALASPRAAIAAEELIEMDFGSWEGRRWDEVPQEDLDEWARDLWCYRPGGGESARAVASRWQGWLEHLRHAHADSDQVIAVTHAGVMRVALAQSGALALGDVAQLPIEFGSVQEIRA
jgi:alpha-ribazole phosphatase